MITPHHHPCYYHYFYYYYYHHCTSAPFITTTSIAMTPFLRSMTSTPRPTRALKFLPRSYKLWYAYLSERKKAVLGKVEITHKKYQILVNTYERALVHLSKMPRIWLDLCQVLVDMKKGTLARRTFDRALQALPITQHNRVRRSTRGEEGGGAGWHIEGL